MLIWEQLLRQDFKQNFPGEVLNLHDWTFDCLCSFQHGLQHGDGSAHYDTSVQPPVLRLTGFFFHNVTVNGVFHAVWDGIDIPEPDLLQYVGLIPKPGQSAEDYINEHFDYL